MQSVGRFRCFVAALAVGLAAAGHASAQTYPSKPVRIIVPYGAGTATDAVAREVSRRMGSRWNGAYVENVTGAGGVVGTQVLQRAEPDGYTVAMIANGHAMNLAIYPKLPFDPVEDFTPVMGMAMTSMVILAYPPAFRSLQELIATAKNQPGKVNYGSTGNGSLPHLTIELMRHLSRTEMTHVPYRATGQLMPDLLSGRVTVASTALSSALPLVRSGKLAALAVSTPARSPVLPDVPAVAEILPGYDVTVWIGMILPKNAPKSVVDKLYGDLQAEFADPQMIEFLAKLGMQPDVLKAEQFWARTAREVPKWLDLVRASGAKID